MGLAEFVEVLPDYCQRVCLAGHDARRNHFFDLAQKAFCLDLASCQAEERVYQGWVDTILGMLVFEFKTDSNREISDTHREVRKYLSRLHEQNPSARYTIIISDGPDLLVFQPVFVDSDMKLEPLPTVSS